MKWRIVTVGRPALDYAKNGSAEYLKRLKRYTEVEVIIVKDGSAEAVSERLLKASEDCLRIALDERGEIPDTAAFTKMVDQWEMQGTHRAALLIGGSDGHTQELRKRCDKIIALSKLTLQHELALVVLLEQIYRIYTIKRGEPYHR